MLLKAMMNLDALEDKVPEVIKATEKEKAELSLNPAKLTTRRTRATR